jgi:hypothetical protein
MVLMDAEASERTASPGNRFVMSHSFNWIPRKPIIFVI